MANGRLRVGRLAGEEGFALVGAVLVMVLVTGLASAALLYSQMDVTIAGNYRVQRTAEVAADGALDLAMAMIYGAEEEGCAFTGVQLLPPPLGIPANLTTSVTSKAVCTYADAGLDVEFALEYKQEDNVNYNGAEAHADEVVRYGKDYNYQNAEKEFGKQPVYTVTFRDRKTGTRGEADLISTIGFKTPAAIYVKGQVRMEKNPYANEEKIEVTSGRGTPALATTGASTDVFIQRAASLPDNTGIERSYRDQAGGTFSYFPDYRVEPSLCVITNPNAIFTHPSPSPPYCPLTTLRLDTGAFAGPKQCWTDLFARVYSGTPNPPTGDIGTEVANGRFNNARDMMHILLGVGERDADLDGAASFTAAKATFNFDVTDASVVQYGYRDQNGSVPTIEQMLGTSFGDLRSLADQVLVGDQTVRNANCANVGGGKDVSGMTFGSAANPEIVFFESNMNDDGSANGNAPLVLVTTGGPVHGYGILVVNGDASIYGSIDWTGLMVVRGKLTFYPWQGGTVNFRSGPDLATTWKGWIMVGGDNNPADPSSPQYGLRLWTYAGGSIVLGYSSSEIAMLKGIISSTVPHKVLSWRRSYQ